MKRREFIIGLGGVATAWPLLSRAQQVRKPAKIGVLSVGATTSDMIGPTPKYPLVKDRTVNPWPTLD